jgi:hypothetical protein
MIPKPNGGGERALGIPTIRDRVVQTAAKLVLEPIFEADFEDNAYGYRPARRAVDAVKEVHRLICRGHTDVVDADLSKYFDSIPHCELLKSVARRIVDRHVLRLIKLWLKAPVEEVDGDGKRRMSGGKSNTRGTPQGGVASSLLANIYTNRFLKHRRLTGRGETFRARVVSYADDFVILSRGRAAEALAWTKAVMTTQDERRQNAAAGNNDPWPDVRDTLNRPLSGWSNYFCYGTRRSAYRGIDHYVYERVRDFLARRHKIPGAERGGSPMRSFTENVACSVSNACPSLCPDVGLAVKPIGERSAGNPHAAFDERGWETGRLPIGSKLPRPSSTLQERRYRPRPPASGVPRQRPYRCTAASWRFGPIAALLQKQLSLAET